MGCSSRQEGGSTGEGGRPASALEAARTDTTWYDMIFLVVATMSDEYLDSIFGSPESTKMRSEVPSPSVSTPRLVNFSSAMFACFATT